MECAERFVYTLYKLFKLVVTLNCGTDDELLANTIHHNYSSGIS